MEIPFSVLCAIVTALAVAIGVLYRQNLNQQNRVEGLLEQTKVLMGSLAELIRSNNDLMIESKRAIADCKSSGSGIRSRSKRRDS